MDSSRVATPLCPHVQLELMGSESDLWTTETYVGAYVSMDRKHLYRSVYAEKRGNIPIYCAQIGSAGSFYHAVLLASISRLPWDGTLLKKLFVAMS